MLKEEIKNYVDKGLVKFGEATLEFTFSNTTGSLYLNIEQKAINKFTTDRYYNGGFWDYISDEDFLNFEEIIQETYNFMMEQEKRSEKEPLVLHKSKDCSDIYVSDNEIRYKMQETKEHFEILLLSNGEPDYYINRPVKIEGKIYFPMWSWWLDHGCFLKENTNIK